MIRKKDKNLEKKCKKCTIRKNFKVICYFFFQVFTIKTKKNEQCTVYFSRGSKTFFTPKLLLYTEISKRSVEIFWGHNDKACGAIVNGRNFPPIRENI